MVWGPEEWLLRNDEVLSEWREFSAPQEWRTRMKKERRAELAQLVGTTGQRQVQGHESSSWRKVTGEPRALKWHPIMEELESWTKWFKFDLVDNKEPSYTKSEREELQGEVI